MKRDQANLSLCARLEARARALESIRRRRVARLRRQIRAGSYRVAPEQIAAAMLAELCEARRLPSCPH